MNSLAGPLLRRGVEKVRRGWVRRDEVDESIHAREKGIKYGVDNSVVAVSIFLFETGFNICMSIHHQTRCVLNSRLTRVARIGCGPSLTTPSLERGGRGLPQHHIPIDPI